MNVLVVDDDMATVQVIRDNVNWKSLNINNVFVSYNIGKAKEILSKEKIDIVISDIEMPQGSGLDLLKWFRDMDMKGEFLFLTCHENFSYASDAVKLHAFDYMLKPFNVSAMEKSVKKIVSKISETEEANLVLETHLLKEFYQSVLEGRIDRKVYEDILGRNLGVTENMEYILVTSRITNTRLEEERMNHSMFVFILENLHNEAIFEGGCLYNINTTETSNSYILACLCPAPLLSHLETRVRNLIQSVKNTLKVNISVCIGEPSLLTEIYAVYKKHLALLSDSLSYNDSYFYEFTRTESTENDSIIIDTSEFKKLLMDKQKLKIMSILKKTLSQKMQDKSLTELMLFTLRQTITQCVYECFALYNVDSSLFMSSAEDVELTVRATESTTDMIRWCSYIVDCFIERVEEELNSESDVEKINRYIRENFKNNIGRSEVAEYMHLAPEYVAKLYKKKTGTTIKDYLNEYRISESKLLLQNPSLRVSDISDMVGFESFTYFSTIFKKYTGMSPNEYRKSLKI